MLLASAEKLKKLDQNIELDALAIKELNNKINTLQLEVIEIDNALKTKYNIDNKISKIQKTLKLEYSDEVDISNIPFKDVFDQVIVLSRTHLKFVINLFDSNIESAIKEIKDNFHEFLIRKTAHKLMIEIVFK